MTFRECKRGLAPGVFLMGQIELEERTLGGLHAALLPCVKSLEGLKPDSPILDLACGTGAWLQRLNTAGYGKLWGIDRDFAHFGARSVARYRMVDLDDQNVSLVEEGTHFALITAIEIIEHVANPSWLINLAVEALAPGGWILITSPNIYSLRARMRFLLGASMPYFESGSSRFAIEPDHAHPLILEAYRRKIFDPFDLAVQRVWSYPEQGGAKSRWFARFATRVIRGVLNEDLPGDILCLLLRDSRAGSLPTKRTGSHCV